VPEVPALRGLTADRLAALNYGSIKAMVPGQEGPKVLEKLRRWAGREGAIRLTNPDSPATEAAIQVSGVDTDAIVEKARGFDSTGAQQRVVRDAVMQALGLADPNALWHAYEFVWRGTRREVEVAFANVRDAADALFDGPADGWRVVVDWPFDEPGHDRAEDVARLVQLQAAGRDRRVLVWNPLFFSRKTRLDLGRLTILTQLLKEEMFQQYAAHLGLQDRATARGILESQRSALTNTVRLAVEAAYGVRPAGPGQLDAAHDGQETRFWSLSPAVAPQPPAGATLADALQHLAGQALAAEYPAHPNFDPDGKKKAVGRADLGRVWEVVQAAGRHPDRYAVVERALRPVVRQVVEPLRLGTMAEDRFVLGDEWRAHLERHREAAGADTPKVHQVKAWLDLPQRRGLPAEVGNLVVLAYALQTNRTVLLNGTPDGAGVERLHRDADLKAQPLPTAGEWAAARGRAASLFGVEKPADLLTGANVVLLEQAVRKAVKELAAGAADLPGRLAAAAAKLHAPADAPADGPRHATAARADRLVRAVQGAVGAKPPHHAPGRDQTRPDRPRRPRPKAPRGGSRRRIRQRIFADGAGKKISERRDGISLAISFPVCESVERPSFRRCASAPFPRGFLLEGDDRGGSPCQTDQAGDQPQFPAFVRHAFARSGLRYSHRAGTLGPCGRNDDDDLHARVEQGWTGREESIGRMTETSRVASAPGEAWQVPLVGWFAKVCRAEFDASSIWDEPRPVRSRLGSGLCWFASWQANHWFGCRGRAAFSRGCRCGASFHPLSRSSRCPN